MDVKEEKHKFLTVEEYQKHQPIIIFRKVNIVTSVSIHLFHRQTNIILAKIECQNLNIELTQSSSATFVKAIIDDLLLYEIGDFQSCKEQCENKNSHLILKRNEKSEKILEFNFSTYKTDEFTNKHRIANFIDLSFNGLEFHYYHQYTMRLFDYFFVQILCVVLEPELVIANKNLLEQLEEGDLKEEISVLGSYDDIMKRFINPFFSNINISLNDLVVYLKPGPVEETYFISTINHIKIHNDIKKESKRFADSKLHNLMHKHLWEEDYYIDIEGFSFKMLEQEVIPPINLNLTYNRHINSNLIKYLFKDIGEYDQSSYLSGKIEKIEIDFSRWTYLNFIKFINFNILFEDLLDHLYVHNYKITKAFKP